MASSGGAAATPTSTRAISSERAPMLLLDDLFGGDRDDLAPPLLGPRPIDLGAPDPRRRPFRVPEREHRVPPRREVGGMLPPLAPFFGCGAGRGSEQDAAEEQRSRDSGSH